MIRIFSFPFFLLLPHFYSLLLSPLNRSSHSSFLPIASFNSSTRHRPKSLPSTDNADPSPYPALTTPIDLFVLCPYLSAISFFLYSVSQSFSISNTKTHDRQCWVLILLSWLTKTTLLPWLGFMLMCSILILMNGFWFCWWLMNGGWVSLVSWWLLANLMIDDGFYFYFDE